jgi:alkanesulfonate monooxygenase SsuD/methylene tetrahydromethanopterin reductase-like flavin-dependent oxidoreductase (luciferase family)
MQNNVSRQWALLTPFVPGEVFTAQAQQIEALGMAGILVPEIYSSHSWASATAPRSQRVKLGSGIANAFVSSPFEIGMTAMIWTG